MWGWGRGVDKLPGTSEPDSCIGPREIVSTRLSVGGVGRGAPCIPGQWCKWAAHQWRACLCSLGAIGIASVFLISAEALSSRSLGLNKPDCWLLLPAELVYQYSCPATLWIGSARLLSLLDHTGVLILLFEVHLNSHVIYLFILVPIWNKWTCTEWETKSIGSKIISVTFYKGITSNIMIV